MNRPTLAQLKAIGRDPFAIFRADEALAIDGAWLARVLQGEPLAFWDDGENEQPSPDERLPYDLQKGVAVYDIEGPLTQRGWLCWQGYDSIGRDLERALADARVRQVLLRVNSPGGAAAGAFEGARRMRRMVQASGKRVVAFADEMAFSAGYCLACVADEIALPEPGSVGSVGVIAGLQSYARAMEKAGLDTRILTSGAEKADGHPALPLDADAIARAQARVDALADIFVRWVSERRGMAPEAVRGLEAGIRMGRTAVDARLADRVVSFHDLLAEMQQAAQTNVAPSRGRPTAARAAASRTTVDETQLQALCAATGTDTPEAAVAAATTICAAVTEATGKATTDEKVGALSALGAKAAGYDAAVARADRAEKDLGAAKLEQLIARGTAEGKLTPAQCAQASEAEGRPAGWARRQTPEALEAFLADAPRVVPPGEVKSPEGSGTSRATLPVDVAAAVAKARESGWMSLSDREKHAITKHDADLAARLRGAQSAA